MYYILYGEDEFSRTEEIKKMRAKMGDRQFADLNITQFDGRKVTLGELQHACDTVPFLTDKRLVIVEGLLARLEPRRVSPAPPSTGGDKLAKELKEYLAHLPETTRLVFSEAGTLAKNNPILKYAEGDQRAHVKEFKLPTARALPKWIQERVKAKGGTIEANAVSELAAHVGSDLRLLDNEIAKLLTYRRNEPIRAEDVRALVTSAGEADIFALVDAIGRRETAVALELLHAQLDHGAAPVYLLTMIVRQFRLLLQMKDLAARGLTRDAACAQLKLLPFVAEKTWNQTSRFTLPQLESAYQKLLETDLAIKTGRSEPIVALDVLVAELTR